MDGSSILSFPAIAVHQVHERSEGLDGGHCDQVGEFALERILQVVVITVAQFKKPSPRCWLDF